MSPSRWPGVIGAQPGSDPWPVDIIPGQCRSLRTPADGPGRAASLPLSQPVVVRLQRGCAVLGPALPAAVHGLGADAGGPVSDDSRVGRPIAPASVSLTTPRSVSIRDLGRGGLGDGRRERGVRVEGRRSSPWRRLAPDWLVGEVVEGWRRGVGGARLNSTGRTAPHHNWAALGVDSSAATRPRLDPGIPTMRGADDLKVVALGQSPN